jgi:hypothetical protein
MFIIEYLMANQEAILAAIASLHVFCQAIVNLTPTPKDNEILAKVYRWVEIGAGLITKRSKD